MKVTILVNPITSEITPFIKDKSLEDAAKEFLMREQGSRRAEQKIKSDEEFNQEFIKFNSECKNMDVGFWCTQVDDSTMNIYLIENKTVSGWIYTYQQNDKRLYKILKVMTFDGQGELPPTSPFKLFEKEKTTVQLELKALLQKRRKDLGEI